MAFQGFTMSPPYGGLDAVSSIDNIVPQQQPQQQGSFSQAVMPDNVQPVPPGYIDPRWKGGMY